MKILVCGGRDFDDYEKMKEILDGIFITHENGFLKHQQMTFIFGGANGADKLAEKYYDEFDINKYPTTDPVMMNKRIFPADWKNKGMKAGIIRNVEMIGQEPDLVIAFWDGKSKGTQHTITLAKQNKINTMIVYF